MNMKRQSKVFCNVFNVHSLLTQLFPTATLKITIW